jgi:hypothetical protein
MSATSPIPNRLSLSISVDDLQSIKAAQKTVTELLDPHLVNLGTEDRQGLLKMGPRTVDFVTRAMSYMRAMPEYLPPFVDIEEFQKDLDAIGLLRELQHPLEATRDMVDDSLMLAGSEAYTAALSIYDSLKSAAKHGSPEAQAAIADLGTRLGPRGPGKGKTAGGLAAAPSSAP